MLTKYYIEIDGVKSEMPKGCLQNWDEIECVYKRSDLSGVTRSFTTQFEFVGEMYDKLMALFLRDGVNAHAGLSLYTITNEWEWKEQFSCELDFSSIEWNNYTVKINCIDDSLAAIIKANKGTKYEVAVGSELTSNKMFLFHRLPIKNSITYEYTGGTSDENDGSLEIGPPANRRIYMGVVNSEDVFIGGALMWEEDQTQENGSYMITALKNVDLTVSIDLTVDQCISQSMHTALVVIDEDNNEKQIANSYLTIGGTKTFVGDFISEMVLFDTYPPSSIIGIVQYWATVRGKVWEFNSSVGTSEAKWVYTGLDEDEYRRKNISRTLNVSLKSGEKIAVVCDGSGARIYSGGFTFSWFAKGETITTTAFTPQSVGQYILNRMSAGKINVLLDISEYDERLSRTLIIAAESLRGLKNAKLYSSFTEFADWMETVFGYTYCFGEVQKSMFKNRQYVGGGMLFDNYSIETASWSSDNSGLPSNADIIYLRAYGKFVAFNGQKYYVDFPTSSAYNDPATGFARTDTVFEINRQGQYDAYYFQLNKNGSFNSEPIPFTWNIEDREKPFQKLIFCHRSELFNSNSKKRIIGNIRDVEYSVDSGIIYSAVNIGYDKKDYQNVNGRDEFNFNNTYTTGCTVCDKTLTLKSKYRADCYGMEFAAQKRGKDTTDNTSDKDVFFVYCEESTSNYWSPDTTTIIENAISEDVFNGTFSPLSCIDANAGYIGRQGNGVKLEFASSEGNSEIIIDGRPLSSDIILSDQLLTYGVLAFSCGDVDEKISPDELIEVVSQGITYRGFIKEVSFKYAKAETVKYKLIVKEIEL